MAYTTGTGVAFSICVVSPNSVFLEPIVYCCQESARFLRSAVV